MHQSTPASTSAVPPPTNRPPNTRPRLSTGRKLTFALIAVLLLAGLAEGGLRVAYRISRGTWNFAGTLDASERLYVPHPYNAYSLSPNETIVTHVGTVHTNQWGNRGPDQTYDKPPGVIRILTLGGSTTFCPYASDDLKTWPAQLERLLNERLGRRAVEVVNYAAAGYNSADIVSTFSLRAIDRNPDIVIFHEAWNDIGAAIVGEVQSDYTNRRKAGSHAKQGWWFNLAIVRTYVVLKGRLAKAQRPEGKADGITPRAVEIYERNVESLVLLAKPRGITPVLLTYATRLPPDDDPDWAAHMPPREKLALQYEFTPAGVRAAFKAYNDAVRRVAARQGVPLIDMANLYPREAANWVDFAHKSDAGLEAFARIVAGELVRQGLVAETNAAR